MGLGKTIQSITFLYEIFSMGIRGPFLIIAPLSTITNWEREFRTWTHMNVIVYHGSQISRQMILQYEMFYRDSQVQFVFTSSLFASVCWMTVIWGSLKVFSYDFLLQALTRWHFSFRELMTVQCSENGKPQANFCFWTGTSLLVLLKVTPGGEGCKQTLS